MLITYTPVTHSEAWRLVEYIPGARMVPAGLGLWHVIRGTPLGEDCHEVSPAPPNDSTGDTGGQEVPR